MKDKLFSRTVGVSLVIVVLVSVFLISGALVLVRPSLAEKTEAAAIKTVSSQIQADGAVVAQDQATLHFQTGGKLIYLPFKVGDSISKGQTIASLDTTVLQKQLTQALNTYRSTRDTFDQAQQSQGKEIMQRTQEGVLNSQGAGLAPYGADVGNTNYINDVAKRIVDQNQANLDNSVLNVEITQQAIQLSTLTSPLTGVITAMDVMTPNVNVPPLTSFTVADPSSLVFRANISESDIDYVAVGSAATIKLSGGLLKEITGTVDKIYPDKVTLPTGEKVYQVDIVSPVFDTAGKMGQTGIVLIQSTAQSTVRLIPTWTVLNHDSVWVLSNGSSVLRQITVGKTHGDMTEVLDGLQDNDQVITNPQSIAAQQYQLL